MQGQLCTVGVYPNLTRLFYYDTRNALLVEIIDRRNREQKHLLQLVDADGKPVQLPAGARFVHVKSGTEQNLLENHLRLQNAQKA